MYGCGYLVLLFYYSAEFALPYVEQALIEKIKVYMATLQG